MIGKFVITFTDAIFPLKPEAIVKNGLIELRVIWVNDGLFSRTDIVPSYSFSVTEVTDKTIAIQISFSDPNFVSKGQNPDRLSVWFPEATYFLRKTDNQRLSTVLLLQDIPPQLSTQQE